jgi:hypothetical protein
MAYDFSSLSHSEFEDLARDLVGREIELRFEAFPEGRDVFRRAILALTHF